jgi:hypothetical protein
VSKEEFFATVTPALVNFMAVAVPALLLWATTILRNWTAKEREARDRQALHSALKTGMESAEQKYGARADTKTKVEYAIDYANKSTPDAVANLAPSKEVMIKLAQSKAQEITPCPEDSPQLASPSSL